MVASSVLMASLVTGGAARAEVQTRVIPPHTPRDTVNAGLCEDYPASRRTLAAARQDLEVLRRTGAKSMRISFSWAEMEAQPGQYDWQFWDEFIRMATQDYGIELMPYICYTPRWAAREDSASFWKSPPKDPATFGRFVTALVQRYKGKIHSWEIWNEPDNGDYWTGSPADYAALLKAGSEAVHREDPAAKVVLGGLAWNTNYLRTLMQDHGISPLIDVVNLHSYNETWLGEGLEHVRDSIDRVGQTIDRYGHHQELWMAEVGYSSFRRADYVSAAWEARYSYEHTESFQAESLFRTLTLLAASGRVSRMAWYRVNDLPDTTGIIGDVNNRHLGLIGSDGREKPALAALRFFNGVSGRGLECIDDEVIISRRIRSDAEVHCFRTDDDGVVVVAWLKTFVRSERNGAPTDGIDRRQERISIELPGELSADARISDVRGTASTLGADGGELSITRRGETTSISGLTVQGGQVFVIELSNLDDPASVLSAGSADRMGCAAGAGCTK